MLAVIRVRAPAEVRDSINDTLKMLRLTRANHCVLLKESPSTAGMLLKARGCITWGPVEPELVERLVAKRGRMAGDARVPAAEAKKAAQAILNSERTAVKPVFRLNPPSKGFRATKMAWPKGDLGDRGEAINELIERMM